MCLARYSSRLALLCWLLYSYSLTKKPSSSTSQGRMSGTAISSSFPIRFFWRWAYDLAFLPCYCSIIYIVMGFTIFTYNIQLMRRILLGVVCLAVVCWAFDGPSEDLVVNLPLPGVDVTWWSGKNYNQWPGYLQISKTTSFHYVFFSSKNDPDNDPVLLWLNGGPGCSSLIGMSYQNGPFKFLPNSTSKTQNPYSWNRLANLLYIESPGSVGFSIGNPLNQSDQSVQHDNLQALLTFYSKFPTLRGNPLYISGESYAGIYVPYLATAIHQYNNNPTTLYHINLNGLIVGNACTDPTECYTVGPNGTSLHQYEFLYRHGFYTERQYERMRAVCVMGYGSKECKKVMEELDGFFDSTRTSILNIYDKCYGVPGGKDRKKVYQSGRMRTVKGDLDCDDQLGALDFFNNAITQQLLHISPFASQQWQPCNDQLYQNYSMNPRASYYLYPQLIKNYRVWIYSGDVDADVPVTGTRNWLNFFREEFHLPVVEPWREWWVPGMHKYDDQVGGMVWKLMNLTFVTVKNAGHMVPRDQPQAAYEMLEAFLAGRDLPDKVQF